MLEKPDLQDAKLIACLQKEYVLLASNIDFLPLGADLNSAIFSALAEDGLAYFVKLKRGVFDEFSVALPKFLNEQGINEIVAPLSTRTRHLWARLDSYRVILYPLEHGQDGYCRIAIGARLGPRSELFTTLLFLPT